MSVSIKELELNDDYYQYCSLLKQLTKIDPDRITLVQFNDHLDTIKLNPFHRILIAKINDKIVGSTTILIEPKFIHDLSKIGHIEDVVVDSNYRSRGIGHLLIKKAIEFGKEMGCYKIILDCSEKNIGFYEKFGFVKKELQMALYLDH